MQNHYNLSEAVPADLHHLLAAVADQTHLHTLDWSNRDRADVFEHLLNSPVLVTQTDTDDQLDSRQLDRFTYQENTTTIREALDRPNPDPAFLQMIKQYAKREYQSELSGLPREVPLVLYYLTICIALTRLRQRLTTLADDELADGIRWAQRQDWLDPQTQQTLATALSTL